MAQEQNTQTLLDFLANNGREVGHLRDMTSTYRERQLAFRGILRHAEQEIRDLRPALNGDNHGDALVAIARFHSIEDMASEALTIVDTMLRWLGELVALLAEIHTNPQLAGGFQRTFILAREIKYIHVRLGPYVSASLQVLRQDLQT
ncbi:hypothetical protein PV08_10800 [Exophiala spinifera]|uniref:Uncharacterized protein n=1 Tax=Exophiala spinifera TaxID=91928 RepID=A0A0D2AYP4_9EURO|nr:uncharacterized protein PV08_10800 [Exophiala spinifera]KIW11500.1 hypothetical protein PV08_10800 [Exophiala spinifera]